MNFNQRETWHRGNTPSYRIGCFMDDFVVKPIGWIVRRLILLAIIFGVACIPVAAIKYLFFS